MNLFNNMNNSIVLNRVSVLQTHLLTYPIPININNFWNFGFLVTISFVIQILSGVILAVHYSPSCETALYSIQHLMREVSHGWFLRYLHSNMASIVFFVLYIHMVRALMYNSFVYLTITWQSGLLLFVLLIVIAFMGYVLPWGQMSYWAATVILNLFSFMPDFIIWVSGGYLLEEPTLKRFFIFHFALPFVSLIVVVIHILFLHEASGSNPLSLSSVYFLNFAPTVIFMDIKAIVQLLCIIFIQTYFSIISISDPDNLVPSSSLVTPLKIVPEWYLLAFYSILKSIPSKNAGLCFMYLYLQVLFLLSNSHKVGSVLSKYFSPILKRRYDLVSIFNNNVIAVVLGTFCISAYVGLQLPLNTYISYGRVSLFIYFSIMFLFYL